MGGPQRNSIVPFHSYGNKIVRGDKRHEGYLMIDLGLRTSEVRGKKKEKLKKKGTV